MSIKAHILGNNDKNTVDVFRHHKGGTGLYVLTESYQDEVLDYIVATNRDYGVRLNVNASFSGTPDGIHNGGDNSLWAATAISGVWDFASTTQAFAGTKSVDATATINNDQALFTRGTAINSNSYNSLSLRIYIDAFDDRGTKDITLQFRLAGTLLGVSVNLSDYIDYNVIGEWIGVAIPLTDFALTGNIDELVATTVDIGAGSPIDYYLDNIQLEETSGESIYYIRPSLSQRANIYGLEIVLADTLTTTLTDNSVPNIDYDKFMDLNALGIPITFRYVRRDKVLLAANFTNLSQLLVLPGAEVVNVIGTATKQMIKIRIKFAAPVPLEDKFKDRFEVVINEDLSGLDRFTITAISTIDVNFNDF